MRTAKSVPTSCRVSARSSLDVSGGAPLSPSLEMNSEAFAEASPAEVSACDFKLTVEEVLKFLCEVSSPDSVTKLCWEINYEDVQVEDGIAMLDFLESELTFCEFQRLLLRISEEKTHGINPDLAWRLPTHRRLEGFLMHVFLPSVANPPEAKQ